MDSWMEHVLLVNPAPSKHFVTACFCGSHLQVPLIYYYIKCVRARVSIIILQCVQLTEQDWIASKHIWHSLQ